MVPMYQTPWYVIQDYNVKVYAHKLYGSIHCCKYEILPVTLYKH